VNAIPASPDPGVPERPGPPAVAAHLCGCGGDCA